MSSFTSKKTACFRCSGTKQWLFQSFNNGLTISNSSSRRFLVFTRQGAPRFA